MSNASDSCRCGKHRLAQLSKFIDLAAENNSPNVSAILLEYKNENYKDADTMAEFTLEDW